MSAADSTTILLGAADVLTERGWYQGNYWEDGSEPDTCRVCTLGAINVAAGLYANGYPRPDSSLTAHQDALDARRILGEWLDRSIGAWNDEDDRSAEQVITALRECAAASANRVIGPAWMRPGVLHVVRERQPR